MITLTRAQRGAVKRVWLRHYDDKPSYREFRKSVQPTFGCNGAVVIRWCNMWLVIERDGYTHS